MPVQNRIIKIQKRNRALVNFDADKIRDAIRNAADSIGGLRQDYLPGINSRLFEAYGDADDLAAFLAEMVVVCLNSEPHHLITNFPPTIETIQDSVLHVLRSHGFQITADAYECYRWGRHWRRQGPSPACSLSATGFPANGWKKSSNGISSTRATRWRRSTSWFGAGRSNPRRRGARGI